jgi:HTH-type transcriptional regulator/antitoxin HigA
MQNLDLSKTVDPWSSLADTVFVPHTEADYERLVSLLDRLVDEIGEDDSDPLAWLMEIVGVLIEKYEDEHVPELSSE